MSRIAQHYLTMGLVVLLFFTNLILIGALVYYASIVTASHQRYEILREEYVRLIADTNRTNEMRDSRLQEQVYSLQFVLDRKMQLVDERLDRLDKNNK